MTHPYLLLPEVLALRGVEHDPEGHPEGDVYEHTARVMEYLADRTDDQVLLLAAALHDVGKPAARKITRNGRIAFFNHEKVGAKLAADVTRRLGLPETDVERVTWLVRRHMTPHRWDVMRESKKKAITASPWYADLLLLAEADDRSRKTVKSEGSESHGTDSR